MQRSRIKEFGPEEHIFEFIYGVLNFKHQNKINLSIQKEIHDMKTNKYEGKYA